MRRSIAVVGVAVALVAGVFAVAGAGATATKTVHTKLTLTGAVVSPGKNVYEVRGSGVRGAAVQIVKVNGAATGGTSTSTIYDGYGTTVNRDSFTLGKPDANGVIAIKGSGRTVGGTGRYKGASGSYTFTGTDNTKTGRLDVKVTGTLRY